MFYNKGKAYVTSVDVTQSENCVSMSFKLTGRLEQFDDYQSAVKNCAPIEVLLISPEINIARLWQEGTHSVVSQQSEQIRSLRTELRKARKQLKKLKKALK